MSKIKNDALSDSYFFFIVTKKKKKKIFSKINIHE
jgi:hypothetical protein